MTRRPKETTSTRLRTRYAVRSPHAPNAAKGYSNKQRGVSDAGEENGEMVVGLENRLMDARLPSPLLSELLVAGETSKCPLTAE